MRFVILIACCFILVAESVSSADRKRQRFEVASLFHPADPFFGGQLEALLDIVKDHSDGKLKLRRSRKAPGFSAIQIVQSLNAGSIDGVLLDPVGLGYRPAISQVFGGIPFGPEASGIVAWSESDGGRSILDEAFASIGVKSLLCGYGASTSGVFAREEFVWPNTSQAPTIHSTGMANEVYQSLNIAARPLPPGDLYMGFGSGVVDLLVSLNPLMDARAGFAQISKYFYYPSWERSSSFALLLVSLKKWQSLSDDSRGFIAGACQVLNSKAMAIDAKAAIATIAEQGANDTIVKPWPAEFLQAAQQVWVQSASKLAERHPSLALAFEALAIPGALPE